MPEPTPSPASADRNLLLGILALQMDFVTRDALLEAMGAWVLAKHKPLGLILVEQGGLAPEEQALVEAVVHRHVQNHGGDPQRSLASVSSIRSARQELEQIADPDLQASLAHVAARPPGADLSSTTDYSAGTPTSSGLRFRVLRPHARGGLGEVFVARDEELHREVALKEIQARHDDPHSRSRFLLEAEVTGGLEHPGVVPVYGLGCHADGRPFYAMRLIKGDSLQDAIRAFHAADRPGRDAGERRLALRQLLGRFVAVCNAVAYAHSRGVLHRDLKPGNVMLGPYGETLVVDWGLAKVVGRQAGGDGASEATLRPASAEGSAPTQVGAAVGTPAYMSPEQAAGKIEELGPASDVYSLGATLYCLLTGKSPVEGQDAGEILRRVQRGDFAPPRAAKPGVPAALGAVCLKAMAQRPEGRYGTARALADDIEHWLADEPVSAQRERWPARLARWGRRHRPLVAAGAALLVTAVAALAVGLVVVNQERQRTEQALARESQARQRARAALDEMSSQVIADWLARKDKLEPAQRKFLEKALAYYQDFAEESGQTQEARAGVADAHRRVGGIREKLGQHAEAEAAYRRALELYAGLPDLPPYRRALAATNTNLGLLLLDTGRLKDAELAFREALDIQQRLAADFPTVPEYRQELARTHLNLGRLLLDTGRPPEADAADRAALDLFKALAAEFPAVPEYRRELAAIQTNLGLLLLNTGRLKDAEGAFRDALTLQESLAADFPAVPQYRQELARTHNNLGMLLAQTGRLGDSEAANRAAVDLFKALAAEFPAVPEYRHELAATQANLCLPLMNAGRRKEAEAALRDARDIQKGLAADFPAVPLYQAELANTMEGLAELALARKDTAAARRLLEEARPHLQRALDANPRQPYFRGAFCENRQLLAKVLLELGEHAGAAEAAADLARVAYEPAGDAFKAAGFLSRCIPLAAKDTQLPEARRMELAKSYGDRALAALRQAVARGYKDADHLKKDKDLDPLRGRDDFQKLLAELEAAAKPGQKKRP
jgi:serine/threonine-protein kinase